MKKLYVSILVATAALAGFQALADALDLQSRAQLRRHQLEQRVAQLPGRLAALRNTAGVENASRQTTLAFATLADGATIADLEAEGINVLIVKGDIAIVEVAYADVERVAKSPALRTLQLSRQVKPAMDLARQSSGVDQILDGDADLPRAYTGKGVVAAIFDQGVDPNHINFFDADKNNRIDYLAYQTYNATGTGIAQNFYGPGVKDAPPVSDFVTDNDNAYHGTHTLGILAGSYRGEMALPQGTDASGKPVLENKPNPYYGVAQDATLAVTCGELADAFIGLGLAHMDGYAHDYLHAPTVYSLSLGSTVGPHDPNSTMPRFLDMLAQESIVVLSAGNEGDLKIALKKTLTEADTQVKSMVFPYVYNYDPSKPDAELNNTIRYGQIAVYSDDATPFEVQAVIYSKSRGRVAKRLPKVGDNIGTYYCSDASWQQDASDVVGDATFKKAFIGYVGVGGTVDKDTGRYYGMIDYYVTDTETNREDGNYILGFEITGKPGQRIECYCDGLTTWIDSCGLEGYDDGSTNGSISDMAVGHDVITVGSYNTRRDFNTLDGATPGYLGDGFAPGYISGFSSYGTLADGRNLPTVCGPGAAVISSISNPYLKTATAGMSQAEAQYTIDYMCNAKATVDGKTYYWKQEVGTSMSTPFVAGSIALWLEADPTLGTDDVKDIIKKTSVVDEQVLAGDPVQWGAGKFNALAGLKEVIRRAGAGVEGVKIESSNDRLITRWLGGDILNLFLGDSVQLEVAVYRLDGSLALHTKADGDEATLDTGSLSPGIYVLDVNGHSQKIVVK
jgi:hypothetical protein